MNRDREIATISESGKTYRVYECPDGSTYEVMVHASWEPPVGKRVVTGEVAHSKRSRRRPKKADSAPPSTIVATGTRKSRRLKSIAPSS